MINRLEQRKEVKFQLAGDAATTLKRNWGRKVAKKQHRDCNAAALQAARKKAKSAKIDLRFQKIMKQRRERREEKPRAAQGSAVMDSGTTSTVIRPSDNKYVIDTNIPSSKIFTVTTGEQTKGGNQAQLKNGLRGAAATADMVPTLKNNSLVSTSKLADENYHTVFTPTEVLVYDGEVAPHKVLVWKGWRDKATGLWRVPLFNDIKNVNTDTYLCSKEQM